MCGIAGFAGSGNQLDLAAMVGQLEHRGPDDVGFRSETDLPRPVHLGFRRLSIIDLSGGHQPMATADGALSLVFNGEIYNHRELRAELERLGARFVTDHSDSEVLLHGYRQWGEALPSRLNGMFAFALLDRHRGRLFLARDRFGKKPLYYAASPRGFVFASEMSALRRHPDVESAIDPDTVVRYLALGYAPGAESFHKGAHKLPGGHSLTYRLDSGAVGIERFWEYRVRPGEEPAGSLDDWAEELRSLLARAVARRLEADVPLGFFLSGGIDSSSVLALAAQCRPPESLKSYTIGFQEKSFDESGPAREAAAHCGSRHHERILALDSALELIPEVLGRLDEPFVDASILPTYMLSAFARESVTVALGGDGSDELFAGYDPFKALRLARLYRSIIPGFLHGTIKAVAERLPVTAGNMALDFKLRRALRGLDHEAPYWTPSWLAPASLAEIEALTGRRLQVEEVYGDVHALWNSCESRDPVDRCIEFYSHYYLPSDILAKVDRASMLCSLEVRCPYLDMEVVDFVLRLPARVKFHRGESKLLLKRALRGLIPEAIFQRPKKGFGIPVQNWIKHIDMPDPSRASRFGLDGELLEHRWSDHVAGKADHRGLLWAWLTLDLSLSGNAEDAAAPPAVVQAAAG